MKKILCVALTSLLLAACGKTLDGTYADKTGIAEFTFKGNTVEMMGMEFDYKIEDGKVKFKSGDGTMTVLQIKDDNTLVFPMVGELKKR
ncbi:MAG: hypothetical protein RR855_00910 [Comamonas sp.]